MVFISTDAATSFLPLYLLLSPARNYLNCNPCPPGGGGGGGGGEGGGTGRIWVVLLHLYIYSRI